MKCIESIELKDTLASIVYYCTYHSWAWICKHLWSLEIDSNEPIPQAT